MRSSLSGWSGWPLMGLTFLGLLGGIFIEAGDILIRPWGRDLGWTPKRLDWLNLIEILCSFKFLWSPIFAWQLQYLWWGTRRTWIILTLVGACFSIIVISLTKFFSLLFIFGLVILTLMRSSFDVLLVASQMDAVSRRYWGMSENFCMNGYRFGMMFIGSGALFLSDKGVSWHRLYCFIALLVAIGIVCVAFSPTFSFLNKATTTKSKNFWHPFVIWFSQPGSWMILLLLMTYRAQDALIDPQREYFLLELGFSKTKLGAIGWFVPWMGVIGGFLAGACIRYKGYFYTLTVGACIHGLAGVGLFTQSLNANATPWTAGFFLLEQTTRGFSMISIYSFQLICCQFDYAVSQLALLAAATDFGTKIISLRSGWIAQELGWPFLFAIASGINIPLILLINYVRPFISSMKLFTGKKLQTSNKIEHM